MTADNKSKAKIALVDFSKSQKKEFWQRQLFALRMPWLFIGNVKDYQVLYLQLPWQEKDFLQLTLEKQRQIFIRVLKNAKKRGCVICGLPMHWRLLLSGNGLLDVPCGKELSLERSIEELKAALGGLAGKKVAVIGVDDKFAKAAADKLLAADCSLLLTGTKAKSLSDWYYRNYGLAIPVFRTEKACEAADGVFSLSGAVPQKYEKQTVIYGDYQVKVKGEWSKPFADGRFSCGLAVALLAAGGERESEMKNTAIDEDGKQVI